jgi:hypothetical protein
MMRRGHDVTAWLNKSIDWLVMLVKGHKPALKKKKVRSTAQKQKTAAAQQGTTVPDEDEIDAILDKLKRSGYGALSDKEKEQLFMASRKR